jgi:hypothetical protein
VCKWFVVGTQAHEAKMAEFAARSDDAKLAVQEIDTAGATARKELTEQLAALNGTYTFSKQKIKFDIGGVRYSTARSTLQRAAKDSLLATMASGRFVSRTLSISVCRRLSLLCREKGGPVPGLSI